MSCCVQCKRKGLFLRVNRAGVCRECEERNIRNKSGTAAPKKEAAETDKALQDRMIPSYLAYPDDPIAQKMFGEHMEQAKDERLGYRFMLYNEVVDPVPERETIQIGNEINYYYKENSSVWYSVAVMYGNCLNDTPVKNWVETADDFLMRVGATDMLLRTPSAFRDREYKRVKLYDMGEWQAFNRTHGFDESHVYGHVFYLDNQLYKKFILVARIRTFAWRVEVNIPTNIEKILPPDFVPPALVFGSFYPAGEALGEKES